MRTLQKLFLGVLSLLLLSGCGGVTTDQPTNEIVFTPTITLAPTVEPTEIQTPTPTQAGAVDLDAALAEMSLADFFDQAYQLVLERDPEGMLELGMAADPDAPQTLTCFSLACEQETRQLYQTLLGALHTYDYDTLDPFDQVSYQVFEWFLLEGIREIEFANFEYLVSPLSVRSSPQLFIMFFTESHPLNTPADAEGYVARIHLLDEKIDELIVRLEAQAKGGFIAPRMVIEYGRSDLKNYLGYNGNASPLRSVFLSKTSAIGGLDESARTALEDELTTALKEEVFPAFGRLDDTLAALQAQAPEVIGLSAYEKGGYYYSWLLHNYTTTFLTADEIHAQGIAETERIAGEMRQRFEALGYDTTQDFPALFNQLQADTGSLSGEAIAQEYQRVLSLADEQVGDFFDQRPADKLEVVGGNAGNYYSAGSLDGTRPGKFFAYTGGSQAVFKIKTVAYHEGIPGHHFQIMGPKQGDLPFFRHLMIFTGYAEGWGLYAEYLASEMGWYANDPAGDLGRLQYEALRSTRMVVDTGIHALGWSFEQAVDYMVENTGLPRGMVQNEVVRYISYPGQATAYLVGKIELMRMRTEAQEALGEAFDLRQFHNVVLGSGSMPLPVLEEVVDTWVAQQTP